MACFSVAYIAESVLLYFMNGNVQLSVYTSGFSLNGEAVKQSCMGFILLCIGFNLINVWMGLGDHLFNNVVATNLLHVV